MPNRDPFEFDDVFVQDYVATCERMQFVTSEEFGNMQAIVTNRYDEPVLGDDGEVRTSRPEYYTVGSSSLWVPASDGTYFTHATDDPDKRIRSNSAFGVLLERYVTLLGRDEMLKNKNPDAGGDGVYAASCFEGYRFRWVTENAGKKWENKRTGQSGLTKGQVLPVELLPDGPDEQVVLPTFDLASLGLSADDLSDFITIAKGNDFGRFQSAAVAFSRDLTDAGSKSKVQAALSDKSLYETLRAS